jgi:hypothetical protein
VVSIPRLEETYRRYQSQVLAGTFSEDVVTVSELKPNSELNRNIIEKAAYLASNHNIFLDGSFPLRVFYPCDGIAAINPSQFLCSSNCVVCDNPIRNFHFKLIFLPTPLSSLMCSICEEKIVAQKNEQLFSEVILVQRLISQIF